MSNAYVVTSLTPFGEEAGEAPPVVAVFSTPEAAKAWAYSQTKDFEVVHVFEVVVDGVETDADWDEICKELL